MIKRTLYFSNPAHLHTSNEQLMMQLKDTGELKQAPIEDIGLLILDNQQITLTQALISKLLANNVALITCDQTHHPVGLFLNLDGNTLQSQKFQAQLAASVPLKKHSGSRQSVARYRTRQPYWKKSGPALPSCFNTPKKLKAATVRNTKPRPLLTIGNT